MPKLKSKKCAAKRMRFTKKGKVKYFRAGKSHILTKKRSKRKRLLRRPSIVSGSDKKTMRTLLPYWI